ncbi:hypothetical protein C3766_01925 [Heyndrickxia coagulans]|nr:hypothetical protein C3766_01925 [Heyndrickxia coagulans]
MAWVVFEMSFWRFEKAKSGLVGVRNVLLEASRPLKKCEIISLNTVFRCIYGFYHTIYCVSESIQKVFQWPRRLQKDKSGLGSVRNVFFESSKGQKESGQ